MHALERICDALPPGRRLQIGAEDAARCDAILDVVTAAAERGLPLTCTAAGEPAAQRARRAAARRRPASPCGSSRARTSSPPAVAYAYGAETDVSYLRLARELAARGAEVLLATHDEVLREALRGDLPQRDRRGAPGRAARRGRRARAAGRTVRVYLPYGREWFRYAMRRLAEAQGA